MRGILLVGLIGCTEREAVDDWGELDGTALLVDEPHQAFEQRVLIEHQPRAKLLPAGPELPAGPHASWPWPLVVADPTPWPRVLVETDDLQVLIYVDRSALQLRVVELADGTGPDGDGLVRLAPGLTVQRLEEEDGRVQLRAEVEALVVEAWLPRQAVDEVWPEAGDPLPELEGRGVTRSLVGGGQILDRPGGSVLATARGESARAHQLVWVDEDSWSRGHYAVTVSTSEVQLQGWAHEDELVDEIGMWGLIGCGGYGSSSCGLSGFGGPTATVPAGTLLASHEAGPVVARTLRDLRVPMSAREEGYLLRRSTVLGEIELWIDAADVR
jgi:hypothetical protein